MLTKPTLPLLLFVLSSIVHVQSKETYVGSRNDDRNVDSREAERNIRRVLDNNHMRFGRRSDIPPLFNRLQFDDANDDMLRLQRAGINHLRFGRTGSNFLRFGRNPNGTSAEPRIHRNNMNFLRLGRGNNDNHMRFGRTDNYMRFGRDQNFMRFGRNPRYKRGSDKRPADSFMRFGRDYDEDLETDDDYNNIDANDDAPLAAFLDEIACKMDNVNCESQ